MWLTRLRLSVTIRIGAAGELSDAATAAGMTSVVYEEAPTTWVSVMTSAVTSRLNQESCSLPLEKMMALAVSAVGIVCAKWGSALSFGIRLPSV